MNKIYRVFWNDISQDVQKVNYELSSIIDAISPDEDLPLYIAEYDFGSIMDDGDCFYYPDKSGKPWPLKDIKNPELKKDFAYAGAVTPAGIVLDKGLELFAETRGRMMSYLVFMPGNIFALWSHLEKEAINHPVAIMSMSAGARNMFMLPNISDKTNYLQLRKKYKYKSQEPKRLKEQWYLFRELAQLNHSEWRVKILLFTTRWLDLIKNDDGWLKLYTYLLEHAWIKSSYHRNKKYYDYGLSRILDRKNLKPSPYLTDTFRHLIAMAVGAYTGFKVANDELFGPIRLLQKIIIEDYGLRQYVPTFMHSTLFNTDSLRERAYYSMLYPTVFNFSPKSRKSTTAIHDLRELKNIYDKFTIGVKEDCRLWAGTILEKVLQEVNFRFFYNQHDSDSGIEITESLLHHDPGLQHSLYQNANREMALNGTFLRACVGLFPTKNNDNKNF